MDPKFSIVDPTLIQLHSNYVMMMTIKYKTVLKDTIYWLTVQIL